MNSKALGTYTVMQHMGEVPVKLLPEQLQQLQQGPHLSDLHKHATVNKLCRGPSPFLRCLVSC